MMVSKRIHVIKPKFNPFSPFRLFAFSDCSDHLTIDSEILCRLISILKSSNSPFATPKRLREELASIQQREKALEELLLSHKTQSKEKEELPEDLNSIESLREDGEIRERIETPLEFPHYMDTFTRPTTPNKSLNIPYIPEPKEELPLREKRDLETALEELKIYKKYYEELKLHMNANELETMQTCAQLTEQIVAQEVELLKQRKCYEFMKEDFDQNLSQIKQLEINKISKEAELKQNLAESQEIILQLKQELENHKHNYIYSLDDYKSLQQLLNESQMNLALITNELLNGKLMGNEKIPEICMDYGVITEDFNLSFITQKEYEQQKQIIYDFEQQKSEMFKKNHQLESLLEIAQEQILSQQRLLNDITDNHVNLRHLVADLQSSTEEKLLMAKLQRDLDTGGCYNMLLRGLLVYLSH